MSMNYLGNAVVRVRVSHDTRIDPKPYTLFQASGAIPRKSEGQAGG